VRRHVVDAALADPERSPRELAWQLTDRTGHFLSESSVYRILKAADLITSPAFILIRAEDRFRHPTHRANELWHLAVQVEAIRDTRESLDPRKHSPVKAQDHVRLELVT
jgi:hypothetical protein